MRVAQPRELVLGEVADPHLPDPGAGLRQHLLDLGEVSPERVLGDIDAIKLRSSTTLFAQADPAEQVVTDVLDRFYDGEQDERTVGLLG